MLFTIGEFSRITGLTVKTLRLYHEKGILIPFSIDADSGYRYYHRRNVAQARIIQYLRSMEFSLSEIKNILEQFSDDADILETLEKQKRNLEHKVSNYTKILSNLDVIISKEKEIQNMLQQKSFTVEEKHVGDILIAGIRYKGKYSDCGKAFAKLCRSFGRYSQGKPFNLYYDCDYKENDADIETCLQISQSKEVEGVSVRTLPGGKCVSLIHQGPYDQLGRSYEKITSYVKEKGYQVKTPSREIYLKGPGMIFRGNPQKYLTEIQMMIEG